MSKIVVLDPGHGQYGNPYPAASGYYEGTQLWKMGQYLGEMLKKCGITVINTRPSITNDPDLATRGQTAGKNKADMFVSLHSDAIGSYATDSARGVTCYYSIQDSARNKKFAEDVSSKVAALLNTRCRGALTRIGNGGLDYYGVIRSSAASGCKAAFLIEHGFHSSPSDVKYLIDDAWLKKIAAVDCKSICDFLGVTYVASDGSNSGSSTTTPPTNTTPSVDPDVKYVLNNEVNVYASASLALIGDATKASAKYPAGEYYIYKEYNGSYNITKTKGVAGGWINPADNKKLANDNTASNTTTDDLPKIEYQNVVLKATVSKSGDKMVKDAAHFKYKEFADPTSDTVLVNKELIRGFEIIFDYLNLSKMIIVKGNLNDTTKYSGTCKSLSKHKSGFGADVCCYDAKGNPIPSDIICCIAQRMGFWGIGKLTANVTHLDIRKEASKLYYDASGEKAVKVADFFDYFDVTQADINAYVSGVTDGDTDTKIMGRAMLSAIELTNFIKQYNSEFTYEIADAFIKLGEIYGVRGDIALCQSCVETGYFKYVGSAVTPDQHNYCGLGVTSNGMKGCSFDTIEKGVEAQIQHLFAYASTGDFPEGRTLVDPRFNYVTRGCAPRWIDLNKKWSSTDIYGQTILSVYNRAKERVVNARTSYPW